MAPKAEGPTKSGSAKRGARARKSAAGASPSWADQRSRLLRAVVEVVAQDGCSQAKIGEIAKRAHVSRATFYEQFADKEECFLAAHRELADRMSAEITAIVMDGEESRAAQAVLGALVELAQREPLAFSFLTHEAMLAGPRALEERDRLIAGLEEQIEHAREQMTGTTLGPDVPARILLGGAIRALGVRMRRNEDSLEQLGADLIEWVDSYSVPRHAQRWSTMTPNAAFLDANQDGPPPSMAPQPLPRGRHRLPPAVVERVQRERLLHATAEAVRARGYANTTVANIVATAGLSREVFYVHFRGKREAFMETFRAGLEQAVVTSAEAFFTSSDAWPERVWESGRAFLDFFVAAPSLAYLGFVESYSLGPVQARRMDDTLLGFTLFLQEGYRHRPQAARLPRLVSEAIAGAIMETAVSYVRQDRVAELLGLLPTIAYVILAPFTGTDAASEFVDRKLGEIQADQA